MKTAIISVTKQGDQIAEKLQGKLFSKATTLDFNINVISKYCMENFDQIIYITSTGIAVRSIASYIKTKTEDPAVVVIDCTGKYVISLLGGHLGGANELTLALANILSAVPVITTASDNMGFVAPDMIAKEFNLEISDMKKAKDIAALLVEGKKVGFKDEEGLINCPKGYETGELDEFEGGVYVTNKFEVDSFVLKLIRKNIILGIGCRKDYDIGKMLKQVKETLEKYNIDIRAVKTISTVEVKREEPAIIALWKSLNCDLDIWTLEDIKKVQHKYEGSDFVEKTIGVRVVSEPCVELSGGRLITNKLNLEGMTLSLGMWHRDVSLGIMEKTAGVRAVSGPYVDDLSLETCQAKRPAATIGLILGTSEGKKILSLLNEFTEDILISTATNYGGGLLRDYKYKFLNSEPLDEEALGKLLLEKGVTILVDASHPYATVVTENCKKVCKKLNIEYLRYERPAISDNYLGRDKFIVVRNYEELAEQIQIHGIEGIVLNTTGSKGIAKIMSLGIKNRIVHRVLPAKTVIEECLNQGVDIEDIIAIKGPVGYDLNLGFIRQYEAGAMLLKDSGKQGGTEEKIEAALAENIYVFMLEREKQEFQRVFWAEEELVNYIKKRLV